jgi:NIPSNAP
MTLELRTYTSTPGRLDDVLARFRDHTVDIFARHGIESLGYWTPNDKPDTLIYLIRHAGSPASNWDAFRDDPAWLAARAKSVENGEIVERIESVFLTPTDFSAIV